MYSGSQAWSGETKFYVSLLLLATSAWDTPRGEVDLCCKNVTEIWRSKLTNSPTHIVARRIWPPKWWECQIQSSSKGGFFYPNFPINFTQDRCSRVVLTTKKNNSWDWLSRPLCSFLVGKSVFFFWDPAFLGINFLICLNFFQFCLEFPYFAYIFLILPRIS